MTYRFRVHGTPKGQPRQRHFARVIKGKAVGRSYDPGTADNWKDAVSFAAKPSRPASPLSVPVRLSIAFLFPRPARLNRKSDPPGRVPHTAKPDIDNAAKAVMDALTQIGFWTDDALVSGARISKAYAAKGEAAGAEIEIETLDAT